MVCLEFANSQRFRSFVFVRVSLTWSCNPPRVKRSRDLTQTRLETRNQKAAQKRSHTWLMNKLVSTRSCTAFGQVGRGGGLTGCNDPDPVTSRLA